MPHTGYRTDITASQSNESRQRDWNIKERAKEKLSILGRNQMNPGNGTETICNVLLEINC